MRCSAMAFLDRIRIVCDAIALGAERAHVDPARHRRQRRDIRRNRRGHGIEGGCVEDIANRGRVADVVEVQPVRKRSDLVQRAFAYNLFGALAERREQRNVAAENVLHIDFGLRIVLVADQEGWARHSIEAASLIHNSSR